MFSMTASAPSVVISNGGRLKVNPEDVTNTTCIRKGFSDETKKKIQATDFLLLLLLFLTK